MEALSHHGLLLQGLSSTTGEDYVYQTVIGQQQWYQRIGNNNKAPLEE